MGSIRSDPRLPKTIINKSEQSQKEEPEQVRAASCRPKYYQDGPSDLEQLRAEASNSEQLRAARSLLPTVTLERTFGDIHRAPTGVLLLLATPAPATYLPTKRGDCEQFVSSSIYKGVARLFGHLWLIYLGSDSWQRRHCESCFEWCYDDEW